MTDQERLDDATERLAKYKKMALRMAEGIDRIAGEADAEASARCNAGQNAVSADLRDIEADIRGAMSAAQSVAEHLTRAYAKGRRLEVPGADGGIVAFAGGS